MILTLTLLGWIGDISYSNKWYLNTCKYEFTQSKGDIIYSMDLFLVIHELPFWFCFTTDSKRFYHLYFRTRDIIYLNQCFTYSYYIFEINIADTNDDLLTITFFTYSNCIAAGLLLPVWKQIPCWYHLQVKSHFEKIKINARWYIYQLFE